MLVPKATPNLLPHAKIRDNPWVSSEEWQWLKKLAAANASRPSNQSQVYSDGGEVNGVGGDCANAEMRVLNGDADQVPPALQPTTAQLLFQSQVQRAAKKLIHGLALDETLLQHRCSITYKLSAGMV